MVQAAGVDDYVSRIYGIGQQIPIGLYVGYYGSQRTGDTIHSPKNCLPGAGWEPVRAGYLTISPPGGAPIEVNEYLVAKGADKRLVLYWYQGRGRVIASEYAGKVWMVVDAIRLHRTDGALVRLVTPVDDGEANAQERLVRFVGQPTVTRPTALLRAGINSWANRRMLSSQALLAIPAWRGPAKW